MNASQRRAGDLYDFAVSRPDGFTAPEARAKFAWDARTFRDALRTLRLTFADDSINLVCDPQGDSQPWLYRLVGTYDEASGWSANALQHAEARLETIEAVAQSVVGATDGRTTDGKRARLIYKTVHFLRDSLNVMSGASE